MTNYNERLDEILSDLREDAISYGEGLHHGSVKSDDEIKIASESLLAIQTEAKQAITSLYKEHAESELEKFKANNHIGYAYEPGEVTDNYIILERVIKKGKNWVFRVQCRWCGNEMNRMTNKFKVRHIDCKEWGVHMRLSAEQRARIK